MDRSNVQNIEAAIARLKRDPSQPVETEIDGLQVEVRIRPRTAEDLFRELGAWEGESPEEIRALLEDCRRVGADRREPSRGGG